MTDVVGAAPRHLAAREVHPWRAALLRRLPPVLAGARYGIATKAAVSLCFLAVVAAVVAALFLVHGRAAVSTLSASETRPGGASSAGAGAGPVAVPGPVLASGLPTDPRARPARARRRRSWSTSWARWRLPVSTPSPSAPG